MMLRLILCLAALTFGQALAQNPPFFRKVATDVHVLGNDVWNTTVTKVLATKLYFNGKELVGRGRGHFASYNGGSSLSWTAAPPEIHAQSATHLDVVFHAKEGDLHWVLTPTLPGAYQYFVNKALPQLGEFRTLWILDNRTFTDGVTIERNQALPPLTDISSGQKTGDETFQRPDGSMVSKYDFSTWLANVEGDLTYWGVAGPGVGSWYIHGGKDYLNGDHLKQELMVHRESKSGDTVLLNMIHGTHFQAYSKNDFPVGKTWGPWLWYLNDGSVEDVKARAAAENAAWPYAWMKDSSGFNERGAISGTLTLSDGRPASGAYVFLGDNETPAEMTTLDQGAAYYYRVYADESGAFSIKNVRAGTYALKAWANGGKIGDVTTVFDMKNVKVAAGAPLDMGKLTWKTTGRKLVWQIGSVDRKATGFLYGGAPRNDAVHRKCPGTLNFTIGTSKENAWCFAQWTGGAWTIDFDVPAVQGTGAAVLSVAMAGYTTAKTTSVSVNGVKVGGLHGPGFLGDSSIARSATLAGEWRLRELAVPAGTIKPGKNSVAIQMAATKGLNGFLYDSVLVEWA